MITQKLGVTLHTIAIGHVGGPPRGVDPNRDRPAGGEIEGPNVPLLEKLAELTGGRSFVATDADALDRCFQNDRLPREKPNSRPDPYTIR